MPFFGMPFPSETERDNYLKKKYNEKDIEDIAYRAYRDLYGEREARDASARQDMSAEQRLDDFSEYEKGVQYKASLGSRGLFEQNKINEKRKDRIKGGFAAAKIRGTKEK